MLKIENQFRANRADPQFVILLMRFYLHLLLIFTSFRDTKMESEGRFDGHHEIISGWISESGNCIYCDENVLPAKIWSYFNTEVIFSHLKIPQFGLHWWRKGSWMVPPPHQTSGFRPVVPKLSKAMDPFYSENLTMDPFL